SHSVVLSQSPVFTARGNSRSQMRSYSSANLSHVSSWLMLGFAILTKDRILRATSGFLATDKLNQPSASQVINSLKQYSITHFTCHKYTNHTNPSNSRLVFQTYHRSQLPKQDILTVHNVSNINSKHAQIAYLSAYSTAENRVAQLAD